MSYIVCSFIAAFAYMFVAFVKVLRSSVLGSSCCDECLLYIKLSCAIVSALTDPKMSFFIRVNSFESCITVAFA